MLQAKETNSICRNKISPPLIFRHDILGMIEIGSFLGMIFFNFEIKVHVLWGTMCNFFIRYQQV
jgi:hypothetical protein